MSTSRSLAFSAGSDGAGGRHGPPVDDVSRLRAMARAMGEDLRAARLARGLTYDEVAAAIGYASPKSVRPVESGVNLTRASRLRPWLQLLGIDVEPFIERYRDVIVPETGTLAVSDTLRAASRRDRRQDRGPRPTRPRALSRAAIVAEHLGLGAELLLTRARKGLERRQVAEAAGIGVERLRAIERGSLRFAPTEAELLAIVKALGLHPRINFYRLLGQYPLAIAPGGEAVDAPPAQLGMPPTAMEG